MRPSPLARGKVKKPTESKTIKIMEEYGEMHTTLETYKQLIKCRITRGKGSARV